MSVEQLKGPSRIGDEDWQPEEWMLPYLGAMGGRDEVVRLLSGKRARIQINAPLALMQQGMESKLQLLYDLWREGLLK